MPLFCSRRTSTILLTLLGLFLVGTVIVLTTVNAYFSIDNSAYILPEELGTWDEIRFGSSPDGPDSWAARIPWLAKITGLGLEHDSNSSIVVEAASNVASAATSQVSTVPAWRDNTPKPYDPSNPPEKIPRIIHQTWKDEHLPPRWQAIRDECAAMHPDYQYMLWTDADSRKFIVEHYPWFVSVFDAYPYPIQRADAIRYFVLHHYGGIYMDLDVGCNRRFDPLLRFEVILPKTIPVGVSNDVILSQKGHPFMDQLTHNLITFNHQYLSNYPTVMFSTGPMFVSASYGLYVDAHGAASPSTPASPSAGFSGIRVLPKSLYGKNAKPADVPNAFFSHFYGSSWHSNDAGLMIFLRDHGRFLMFIGACIVCYGFFRSILWAALFGIGSATNPGRRRSRSSGRWVGLSVGTASSSLSRHRSKRRSSLHDRSVALDELAAGASSSNAASSSRLSNPAPRSHRLSLPLFQLQEQENANREAPQSVLAWVGQTLSRPSSRNEGTADSEVSVATGRPASPRIGKKKGDVLYLPAYFVRGDDSSSSQLSPSSSISSAATGWQAPGSVGPSNLTSWAASLLPESWRGPSPAPSHASRLSRVGDDADVESVGTGSEDDDGAGERLRRSTSGSHDVSVPLLRTVSHTSDVADGRFARSWTDVGANEKRPGGGALPSMTASPDCFNLPNPFETHSYEDKGPNSRFGPTGTLLAESTEPPVATKANRSTAATSRLLRRLPSSGDLHLAEDLPLSSNSIPPPPYPYATAADHSLAMGGMAPPQQSGRAAGDLHAPRPQRATGSNDIEVEWTGDGEADVNGRNVDVGASGQPRADTAGEQRQQQPVQNEDTGNDVVVNSTERV